MENIEALKTRFYSEFENPMNSEPYDTHEGGYLTQNTFLDTEHAVQKVFQNDHFPDKVYKELVGTLNEKSTMWKPKEKS